MNDDPARSHERVAILDERSDTSILEANLRPDDSIARRLQSSLPAA